MQKGKLNGSVVLQTAMKRSEYNTKRSTFKMSNQNKSHLKKRAGFDSDQIARPKPFVGPENGLGLHEVRQPATLWLPSNHSSSVLPQAALGSS
jgi:hypothetical protein